MLLRAFKGERLDSAVQEGGGSGQLPVACWRDRGECWAMEHEGEGAWSDFQVLGFETDGVHLIPP